MTWAKIILANSRARPAHRLVLLALGELADKKGFCQVPVETLENLTGLKTREIRTALRTLEKTLKELLLVEKGGGRGKVSIYRLTVSRELQFPRRKTVHADTPFRATTNSAPYAPFASRVRARSKDTLPQNAISTPQDEEESLAQRAARADF